MGQDGGVPGDDRRSTGRLFDEVPELYDRVRPAYPDELFADLVAITGGRRTMMRGNGITFRSTDPVLH